jgi:hypothetical protein
MQTMQGGEMEAACHCGTVRFRVKLTDGFKTARRCTCSYCRMRGAVAGSNEIPLRRRPLHRVQRVRHRL